MEQGAITQLQHQMSALETTTTMRTYWHHIKGTPPKSIECTGRFHLCNPSGMDTHPALKAAVELSSSTAL